MENYRGFYNILLVEDNPADVELTMEAFSRCQSSVNMTVMPSGIEALNHLHKDDEELPDLILLDLNLPGWDGKSFLKEIKQDSRLRKIPVIILSTSNSNNDVEESYSLNANCYITKPLDVHLFFEKIRCIEAFWLNTVALPSTV
ncbi:MAG: response regulator [Saprospiraceae bacterium]|nr:response regulator [Saprospiraceae bacterium]